MANASTKRRDDYAAYDISLGNNKDGWYVMRQGRILFDGCELSEAAMFAEELYERMKYATARWERLTGGDAHDG